MRLAQILGSLLVSLLVVAGCAGSASPAPDAFGLRAWTTQGGLPPEPGFGSGTSLAIVDGALIVPGAVPAIFPGPLMTPLHARTISEAGLEAIVNLARRAGLLDGPTDLIGDPRPGMLVGHLRFELDGAVREVVGDPTKVMMCITTPCDPAPGSPEAFAAVWAQLSDLASWIGPELGTEQRYRPERLAVLLGPPVVDPTIPPTIVGWPLGGSFDDFGVAAAGGGRCGVIEGEDLEPAFAAFQAANALTRWIDPDGATLGATVQPLLPGEPDPCTGG